MPVFSQSNSQTKKTPFLKKIPLKISFGIGLLSLAYISCTPADIANRITSGIMVQGSPAFERNEKPKIARQSGLNLIETLKVFQFSQPKNKNYNFLLSRSYALYAFGFYEWDMIKNRGTNQTAYDEAMKNARDFYEKGKDFALVNLTRNGRFEKTLNRDLDSFKKALKGMGRGYKRDLFWAAFNWGSYINMDKESPLSIALFPKVEAMMARVLEIDPNYYYGGPHLFFGVAYATRPQMFGGNPAKAKKHFEAALAAYKRKFLMTQVMYATTYAVQTQDRELFEKLLNEVLATEPSVLPEQRLANEMAHLRAKWYLKNADQFFNTL